MNETLTHKGRDFTVTVEPDNDMRHPWLEHECYGVVRESHTRHAACEGAKRPCERPLNWPDRREMQYFYDMKASTELAKRDGWGLSPDALAHLTADLGKAPTPSQITARAVENDYQFLRRYLAGDVGWYWVCITDNLSGERESLGGILCEPESGYIDEVVRELADQLCDAAQARENDLQLAYEGM